MEEIPAGQYACISVSDSGCGMDEKVMENLFEPFFTTKGVGSGTGLGLSMVYGIVRQNHGFIEVESSPGAGSVFRIYFPCIPDRGKELTDPGNETVSLPKASDRHVVVVEDEQPLLAMAMTMLRRLGYLVVGFHSPREALEYVRNKEQRIDLLLTDIVMPAIGGRELADTITTLRPQIKVLFMTGYTEDEVLLNKKGRAGDEEVMQKPFNLKTLSTHLHRLFRNEQ